MAEGRPDALAVAQNLRTQTHRALMGRFSRKCSTIQLHRRKLNVLKHGEFVAPAIALLQGVEPAPNTVDDRALNGVLERFRKNKRASDEPSAMNNVVAVFKDAIALQQPGASAQMRGFALMSVAAGVVVQTWVLWMAVSSGILSVFTSWRHPFLALEMVVVAFLAFYVFPRW